MGSYADDVHRLVESSLENEEEPCCSKNINPAIERKVYFPISNNPFSVSAIEEYADLCLENKRMFWKILVQPFMYISTKLSLVYDR